MEIHSIVVNPARPGPFPKGDQESFQRRNLTKHMQMRKTEANQEKKKKSLTTGMRHKINPRKTCGPEITLQ